MALSAHLHEALAAPVEEGKRRGKDSLSEVTSKISVFAKTQGNVIRSYAKRFRAVANQAPAGAREAADKLQGVLDQIEAAFASMASLSNELGGKRLGEHRLFEAKGQFRPTPGQALYVPPMTGEFKGQGRRCSNCYAFIEGERCALFPMDQVVEPGDVCGYHVPGTSVKRRLPVQPVPPALAGFGKAPRSGTSCGNCVAFDDGRCARVADPKDASENAKVDALGCCALWEGA